jgi:nitrogen fixation-related uncharacterized protein
MSGAVANLVLSFIMLAVVLIGTFWAMRTGRFRWPFRKRRSR